MAKQSKQFKIAYLSISLQDTKKNKQFYKLNPYKVKLKTFSSNKSESLLKIFL